MTSLWDSLHKYTCMEVFSCEVQSNLEYLTPGKEGRHLWLMSSHTIKSLMPPCKCGLCRGCSPVLGTLLSLHAKFDEPLGQIKPYLTQVSQVMNGIPTSFVKVWAWSRDSGFIRAHPCTKRFLCEPRSQSSGVHPSRNEPSSEPTTVALPPCWQGREGAGELCWAQAAAGIMVRRRHGMHPPLGSLVLLILANCMSWHRAMDEVTP